MTLTYPIQSYLFDLISNTIGQNLDLVIYEKEQFLSYSLDSQYLEKVSIGTGIPDCDVGDVYTAQGELEFIALLLEKNPLITTICLRKAEGLEDSKYTIL